MWSNEDNWQGGFETQENHIHNGTYISDKWYQMKGNYCLQNWIIISNMTVKIQTHKLF